MYEYQFNTIFSYAKKENVDAIIVAAGSIGCFAPRENIAQMMKMFDGIPCVLVSYKMDEYINILFDNYTGIKEGIDYLIDRLVIISRERARFVGIDHAALDTSGHALKAAE